MQMRIAGSSCKLQHDSQSKGGDVAASSAAVPAGVRARQRSTPPAARGAPKRRRREGWGGTCWRWRGGTTLSRKRLCLAQQEEPVAMSALGTLLTLVLLAFEFRLCFSSTTTPSSSSASDTADSTATTDPTATADPTAAPTASPTSAPTIAPTSGGASFLWTLYYDPGFACAIDPPYLVQREPAGKCMLANQERYAVMKMRWKS